MPIEARKKAILDSLDGRKRNAENVSLELLYKKLIFISAFLDAVADGTVGLHMMDKYFAGEDYPYEDSGFRYHQVTEPKNKGYPAVWIQFTHNAELGKTLGNQYKDQFHLLFTGLGQLLYVICYLKTLYTNLQYLNRQGQLGR